jgi:hypothetical protein
MRSKKAEGFRQRKAALRRFAAKVVATVGGWEPMCLTTGHSFPSRPLPQSGRSTLSVSALAIWRYSISISAQASELPTTHPETSS